MEKSLTKRLLAREKQVASLASQPLSKGLLAQIKRHNSDMQATFRQLVTIQRQSLQRRPGIVAKAGLQTMTKRTKE